MPIEIEIKKMCSFPGWRNRRCWLGLLLAIFLITFVVSGCSLTSSKQVYENPEFGIRLEKPRNWKIAYYERSGSIVLAVENKVRQKTSARVEIYGVACISSNGSNDAISDLKLNIKRIRGLYDLDSVLIVQEPIQIENRGYAVTQAIIKVPSMAMTDDLARYQMEEAGPDIFQTIDMRAIRDKNNDDYSITVYIYPGSSEELNVEAEDIVDSIKLTCSTEP